MKFSDLNGAAILRGNTYTLRSGRDWSCVEITTCSSMVDLIMDLVVGWSPPFFVLYVHVVPRTDHPAGRYQSPPVEDLSDLKSFLSRFRELFEGDGRHHLWVASPADSRQIVYDRHEILYVYGDDDEVVRRLGDHGFQLGTIEIPAPHVHNYNADCDELLAHLMGYWDWSCTPLQETDEE